jgi:iron complex outermembrane receptor protein
VRTGAYTLVNVYASYALTRGLELAAGLKNLLDQNYALARGFPLQGRTFYIKTRMTF